MSIIGHGIDLVEVARISDMIRRHGNRFLHRCFTPAERKYCRRFRDAAPHFAGRFAAKEAIVKALGTGLSGKISWTEMEILPDAQGKPVPAFTGHTRRLAAALGITKWHISISHTLEHAMASALAEASWEVTHAPA
jgi:holo-[acyl-carrier protein] synthase